MKNKFRISPELKPYIRAILAKREEKYRFKREDQQFYVLTDMSGVKFHNIVQRAKCIKLTNETGILHVTKRESENGELVEALKTEYKASSYVIAGKAKED